MGPSATTVLLTLKPLVVKSAIGTVDIQWGATVLQLLIFRGGRQCHYCWYSVVGIWINVKKLWKIRIKLSGMTSNLRSVQKRLRKVLIISLNYPFNLHYWLLLFIPRSARLNSSLTSMAVPSHVGYNNNSPEHFQNEVLLQQGGRNLSIHCFSQHFLWNFSFSSDGMHQIWTL